MQSCTSDQSSRNTTSLSRSISWKRCREGEFNNWPWEKNRYIHHTDVRFVYGCTDEIGTYLGNFHVHIIKRSNFFFTPNRRQSMIYLKKKILHRIDLEPPLSKKRFPKLSVLMKHEILLEEKQVTTNIYLPLNIQLRYRVIHVVCKFRIMGCSSTSLIFVCRKIGAESFHCT